VPISHSFAAIHLPIAIGLSRHLRQNTPQYGAFRKPRCVKMKCNLPQISQQFASNQHPITTKTNSKKAFLELNI